jgi:chromosome segregation ATPase
MWHDECVKKQVNLEVCEKTLQQKEKHLHEAQKSVQDATMELDKSRGDVDKAKENLRALSSRYKKKNVARRERRKKKQLAQMKEHHKKEVEDLRKELELKTKQLDDSNITTTTQLQLMNEQLEDAKNTNTAQLEKVEIEKQRSVELDRKRLNAVKKASKYKMKAKSVIVAADIQQREATKTMKGRIEYLENENEQLAEHIEEFLNSDDISVFEGGKYSDEIRSVYMQLIANNVGTKKCAEIIRTVIETLTKKKTRRLPQHSLASQLKAEAAALAKIQCGIAMLECENNTLHIDGTKKKFKEFNTVNVTSGDGQSLSLGYTQMSGGTAEDYLKSTMTFCWKWQT